ncbi:MAG: sortase [Patescibacteria group bacterium]|nr:sortase [Patescibacteria group bacterium]
MRINYPSKITIGICLFALGVLLLLFKPKADASVLSVNQVATLEEFALINEIDAEKIPQKILIPDLKLNVNVQVSFVKSGYWEVFDDKAGWGVGSAYPGEIGNVVIFGHAKDNLFGNLKYIKKGDSVFVLTNKTWFEYKVDDVLEVLPTDTKIIAPSSEEKKLTLYTCSGYKDSKRLVVVLSVD